MNKERTLYLRMAHLGENRPLLGSPSTPNGPEEYMLSRRKSWTTGEETVRLWEGLAEPYDIKKKRYRNSVKGCQNNAASGDAGHSGKGTKTGLMLHVDAPQCTSYLGVYTSSHRICKWLLYTANTRPDRRCTLYYAMIPCAVYPIAGRGMYLEQNRHNMYGLV